MPAGVPVSLGYVDVICNALGAGLYDPAPEVGCTIIGSTGMHMRLAATVDDVTLNAEATGYTMPFPVPGHYAQMQSNMAATLNIDWLLDLALGVLAGEGVTRSRADLIRRLGRARHPGQAWRGRVSSLHLGPRASAVLSWRTMPSRSVWCCVRATATGI